MAYGTREGNGTGRANQPPKRDENRARKGRHFGLAEQRIASRFRVISPREISRRCCRRSRNGPYRQRHVVRALSSTRETQRRGALLEHRANDQERENRRI